jgi:sugar/nucleoside kinase (ribokinase family)
VNQSFNPKPVLCAGRVYCDLVFTDVPRLPTLGTETFAGGLGIHAGGGAFITAATLSALGQSSSLLSILPAAPFDTLITKELIANNVDIQHCVAAPQGDDPQITVAIATGIDRAFISRRVNSAIPRISSDDIRKYSHLHIGEIRTLTEHPELPLQAHAAGLTISLDCGWDDELMADPSGLEELIASVDIFLPNEMEADRLSKAGISITTAPLTVIKCGKKGVVLQSQTENISVPTTAVDVIDATGAGDAFNGGFIFEWLRETPLVKCLEVGNACGASAVQGVGGTGGLASLCDISAPFPTLLAKKTYN